MLSRWTASLSALGRMDEARAKVNDLLRYAPEFSLSRVRQTFGLWSSHDVDRLIDLLRKAGLPE